MMNADWMVDCVLTLLTRHLVRMTHGSLICSMLAGGKGVERVGGKRVDWAGEKGVDRCLK